MPQGPYGRGPSQINIPVQKRKQKRMIKRTKERKKKETKKKKRYKRNENRTNQIGNTFKAPLRMQPQEPENQYPELLFFTRKVHTSGKLKKGVS